MKKLLTLILLFTITLYSIPTQAYTLDGNDIPLVQTKNLFDKDTVTPNTFINHLSGNENSLVGFNSSDFIPVLPNTQYITSNMNSNGAQYDINFNWDAQTGAIYSGTFTTRATTAYIRLTASNAQLNIAQLEQGATATSYAPFGFLTLNEIFLDSNIISNPNFTNGTTGFLTENATLSLTNQILLVSSGLTFSFSQVYQTSPFVFPINDKIYLFSRLRSTNNQTSYFNIAYQINGVGAYDITQTFPIANQYYDLSGIITINDSSLNTQSIRITQDYPSAAIANGKSIEIDGNYGLLTINLTLLGIDNLIKTQLDFYHTQWQLNNAFIEGYNEGYAAGVPVGFDEGFDEGLIEGFDNGVASETSFAVGFAQGLLQGGDMETGSSILILIVALIGFGMMIFGFITKRGIFNLLSVAAFIVLGGLLAEFIGFIIITFALVFINVYYAFFGEL